MPVDIIVDYSPALTEAERLLLKSVELLVGECSFSLLNVAHTRWTPWERTHFTVYVLTPWNDRSRVLAVCNEAQIRNLTEHTFKTELAFGRQTQIPDGFAERPEGT